MKLGRFTPDDWPEHTVRLGVVVGDVDNADLGRRSGSETLLDAAAALTALLIGREGADPTRAADYALAVLPGSSVDLLGTWRRSRALLESVLAAIEGGEIDLSDRSPIGPLSWPRSTVRLLSPIDRPPAIRDFFAFETHMKNALGNLGLEVPEAWYEAPSHYITRSASLFGPDEPGIWPAYTEMLDYELEFAIVIGTCGRDIPVERAWEHVAGFTIYNDLSCRDVQRREMATRVGPAKTKGYDGGTGLGPYLVTADEFTSPFEAGMRAYVNDELWSEGPAGSIYWSVEQMVAHASAAETLYPGDVLGSGTVGTGAGIEIDRWIRRNDVVRLEIDGLGALETTITPAIATSEHT